MDDAPPLRQETKIRHSVPVSLDFRQTSSKGVYEWWSWVYTVDFLFWAGWERGMAIFSTRKEIVIVMASSSYALPLLLPLQHKIAHSGSIKAPRVKQTVYDESATIKHPFMDDEPHLRQETKIAIPCRSHGIFEKRRRRAYLSGVIGYIM
ncbi:hypothetical protein BC629DRAFT_1594553 [Irpex lacteus]|nr:hypothetical protein BC629DRAFT_1594553 [Irpex lacteus]